MPPPGDGRDVGREGSGASPEQFANDRFQHIGNPGPPTDLGRRVTQELHSFVNSLRTDEARAQFNNVLQGIDPQLRQAQNSGDLDALARSLRQQSDATGIDSQLASSYKGVATILEHASKTEQKREAERGPQPEPKPELPIMKELETRLQNVPPELRQRLMSEVGTALGSSPTAGDYNKVAQLLQREASQLDSRDPQSAAGIRDTALHAKLTATHMKGEQSRGAVDGSADRNAEVGVSKDTQRQHALEGARHDFVAWAAEPRIAERLAELSGKFHGNEPPPAERAQVLSELYREYSSSRGGSVGRLMAADLFEGFVLHRLGLPY